MLQNHISQNPVILWQLTAAPTTVDGKVDLFLQLKLNDNAIKWMNISYDDDDNEHETMFLLQADEREKTPRHPHIYTHIQWYGSKDGFIEQAYRL